MPFELSPQLPLRVIVSGLLVVGLIWSDIALAEKPGTHPDNPAPTGEASPWLEAVRAQRRAWEAQRRASKEAIAAQRRAMDPWAAAQHEAREQERQERRDRWLESIDRDRQRFRRQGPWLDDPTPWPKGTVPPAAPAPPAGLGSPEAITRPPPPGWDNGWYYQGY